MGEIRGIVKIALDDPDNDDARNEACIALTDAVSRGESISAMEGAVFLSDYLIPEAEHCNPCPCPGCVKTAKAAIFAIADAVDGVIKREIEDPELVAAGNYLVVDGVIKR